MRYLALVFLLASSLGLAQNSAQYRACNEKAKTQMEMNVCASDEAARVDAELNDVYRKLLSKAASPPEAAAKIKAAEGAWIAYRDAYMDAMYPAKDKQTEYGSIYPMDADLLRAKLTQQQVTALKDLLEQYSGAQPSATSETIAQKRQTLPSVASASVPLYPRVIRAARIQGDVMLRLSTDGERVSAVEVESGPPMLAQAAKENVKTWQFEPHTPTSFEVTFRYKLLLPSKCDSECNCDSAEKESVLLQLPTNVDVSAKVPMICDPAGKIADKQ